MKILIAGGAGYIGSTIASYCLDTGLEPVILDDLSTGRPEFTYDRPFYHGDIADGGLVAKVFADHPDVGCTIHCAASVSAPESVREPLAYYRANVAKTVEFTHHLLAHGCRRVVFSSSAAVYDPAQTGAVSESAPIKPGNPYARTKAMCERVLVDVAATGRLQALALRYFNPVGADPGLRTGLLPRRTGHALGGMVAAHEQEVPFVITGADYATRDGTGLRDYIHVWDLARAHVAAVRHLETLEPDVGYFEAVNLGRGVGTTVRELLDAFNAAVDEPLAAVVGPRRPGDCAGSYAACDRARMLLGWEAKLTVAHAVQDALEWARKCKSLRLTSVGPDDPKTSSARR